MSLFTHSLVEREREYVWSFIRAALGLRCAWYDSSLFTDTSKLDQLAREIAALPYVDAIIKGDLDYPAFQPDDREQTPQLFGLDYSIVAKPQSNKLLLGEELTNGLKAIQRRYQAVREKATSDFQSAVAVSGDGLILIQATVVVVIDNTTKHHRAYDSIAFSGEGREKVLISEWYCQKMKSRLSDRASKVDVGRLIRPYVESDSFGQRLEEIPSYDNNRPARIFVTPKQFCPEIDPQYSYKLY